MAQKDQESYTQIFILSLTKWIFNPAFTDQVADKYILLLNLKRTIPNKCKTCQGDQSQLSGTGFLLIRPLFLYFVD